jgi:hypothetical protein
MGILTWGSIKSSISPPCASGMPSPSPRGHVQQPTAPLPGMNHAARCRNRLNMASKWTDACLYRRQPFGGDGMGDPAAAACTGVPQSNRGGASVRARACHQTSPAGEPDRAGEKAWSRAATEGRWEGW